MVEKWHSRIHSLQKLLPQFSLTFDDFFLQQCSLRSIVLKLLPKKMSASSYSASHKLGYDKYLINNNILLLTWTLKNISRNIQNILSCKQKKYYNPLKGTNAM